MKLRRFFSALILALFMAFPFASAQNDTTLPGDVERLTATAGNGEIKLQWDLALDDTGVVGYKVYYGTESVNNQNQNRYLQNIDAGNLIEYAVTGLKNETTYYFAVTAYDSAGNESENYSPEVSATPSGSLVAASLLSEFNKSETAVSEQKFPSALESGSSETLTLVSAEGASANTVKVVFSQKPLLPQQNPEQAFVIQDNLTLENLKIHSVKFDETDTEGKTILLETDVQVPETEYVVTAGPELTNTQGKPIISGTSDSALFIAVAGTTGAGGGTVTEAAESKNIENEKLAAAEETQTAFELTKIEPVTDSIFVLTFSEGAVLSLDPVENFTIYEKNNPDNKLDITGVEVNDEGTIVTLTTSLQSNAIYTLEMNGITNTKGDGLEEEKTKFDFQGKGISGIDTTPPEDASNFIARAVKDMTARLQWKGSINSAGDLLEYVMYQSNDAGQTYGKLISLSKDATRHEVAGLSPGEYYFKITAKDAAGNESAGKVAKMRLVETGPGLGLITLASIGLGRVFSRRKKKWRSKILIAKV